MKRYLVFAGEKYYPCGGWSDFYGTYDTMGEALDATFKARENYEWVQIVDTETLKIVHQRP